ncbi:hypothetical protein [Chryseolinea lacunae]|uniref:Uncharacterized protein n=1 Tax=Chryseolinea lacunae TaxID=2801331 RepID=A0ABS1KU63_9BACT|nr:hypothetical protein [Chryseolinea lacunae]MBL0742909.1 hypothetical protein [Chryseolinea lacunae]
MKKQLLVVVLVALCAASYAQTVLPSNMRAQNTLQQLDAISTNKDILYGIPMPPPQVIGDTYYKLYWSPTSLLLYTDKMVEGFPARYDIYADEVELRGKNGVRVMPSKLIKSFVWIDSVSKEPTYFVNAKDFLTESKAPLKGFFEVMAEGSVTLLKRMTVYVKKADYNAVLNVGNRDDKIMKESTLFYLKGSTALEVPSSKKKLLPVFGDKATAVEQYIKEKDLSLSKENDLKSVFAYYNTLVASN